LIVDAFNTYRPIKTLIDSSAFGQVLINDLLREHRIFVEGFSFVPEHRNNVINNLIRLFETGRIYLPFKCKTGHELGLIEVLRKELSDFTISFTKTGIRTYKTLGRHDDTVMALSLACFAADAVRQQTSGMLLSTSSTTDSSIYGSNDILDLSNQNMVETNFIDDNLALW
jgi:hypothetical protein